MRTITFKRKKTFYCCLLKVCCAIEKYPVAIIKNGEEITIEIDDDYHELFLMDCYSGLKISNSLTIPQNENVAKSEFGKIHQAFGLDEAKNDFIAKNA